MKSTIIATSAIIFILTLFLSSCTTEQIPNTAVFTYTRSNGFVPPDQRTIILEVAPGKLTYTEKNTEGKITQHVEKNIDEKTYQNILTAFRDNNFMSLPDQYDRVTTITDGPTEELLMTNSGTTKKVTFLPGSQPPKNAETILSALRGLIEVTLSMDQTEAKTFAEAWIQEAPTYAFDGSNLALKNISSVAQRPTQHTATFTFTSSHGGYGNRTGYMLTQIITEHTIVLSINGRTVTSARIDNKWDELKGRIDRSQEDTENMTDPQTPVTLKFQPAQCKKTPWQQWYEQGGITFKKEPTDAEVLIPYYGQHYNIALTDYKKVDVGVTCEACATCPLPYYITVSVKATDAELLTKLGWEW